MPVDPGITTTSVRGRNPAIAIGGFAVAAWGLTQDVDLKVLLSRQDAGRLLAILLAEYAPLTSQPKRLLREPGLIFMQDAAGTRLDILLADTLYDVLAIARDRE
jgi:hypothetical protein